MTRSRLRRDMPTPCACASRSMHHERAMIRLVSSIRIAAVLLLVAAPPASLHAQRANALTAGVTRPVVARTASTGAQRPEITAASVGPDPHVATGAIIGAGVGAALGIWMAVAT